MKTVSFDPRYYLELDYDTYHDCEAYGCDSICRCGRIENARVTGVSLSPGMFTVFEDKLTKHKEPHTRKVVVKFSDIEAYCVDRLLRIHKAYELSSYTPRICGGYYGEETNGADFDGGDALVDDVSKLVNMSTDIEKVKFVLTREYSFLLDRIKDTTEVSIETITPKSLFKNDDYAMRVKNQKKPYEFAEGVPVGVVHDGRLIDGYNRFASLDQEKKYRFIVLR